MATDGGIGIDGPRRRRWAFAGCIFDEANWTLTVDGGRVAVETKPLELLRELLQNAGELVPKDQLMDKVWPSVEVVEASLPTAIAKLRRALGDDRRGSPIIETVQRLGYRLAVPVEVEDPNGRSDASMVPAQAAGGVDPAARRSRRFVYTLAAALVIAQIVLVLVLATASVAPTDGVEAKARTYTKSDVYSALRKVDIASMERMLAAGWDPNAPLDLERNHAINVLLNNCEWDRGHDRRQMLIAVRTLVDAGARVDQRNVWGDTPYSIARAERYCGPDHPVTRMIHMICYEGENPMGERCLENYVRDASGRVIRQEPSRQRQEP